MWRSGQRAWPITRRSSDRNGLSHFFWGVGHVVVRIKEEGMSTLRILVFGGKGWIGSMLCPFLSMKRHTLHLTSTRADNAAMVAADLRFFKPDRVLCLVGRTHGPGCNTIDYLEQKGHLEVNLRDNLMAPLVLAKVCETHKIHLTVMGTGCIFSSAYDADGQPITQFSEASVPNFTGSQYSLVKGFTDQLLQLFPQVLVLRIRFPITSVDEPRNLISKLVSYKKICSVANSMTVLDRHMFAAVEFAMYSETGGALNLTNPGVMSHNTLLEMYRRFVDEDFTWENFTREEQAQVVQADRSNNMLDTSRLKALYPKIPQLEDAVRDTLESWAALGGRRPGSSRVWPGSFRA
jgi:3,5-epimerase/4-reductase